MQTRKTMYCNYYQLYTSLRLVYIVFPYSGPGLTIHHSHIDTGITVGS